MNASEKKELYIKYIKNTINKEELDRLIKQIEKECEEARQKNDKEDILVVCGLLTELKKKKEAVNMKIIDNRVYLEDALLTYRIIQIINKLHDLEIQEVYRHARVASFETDAVAIARTPQGQERWIGFELKDNVIEKAIQQAQRRRRYFDYFYIILNLPVHAIVDFLLKMEKTDKIDYGIISGSTDTRRYVPVLKSPYKARKRVDVDGKKIPEEQVSIFNFIEEAID